MEEILKECPRHKMDNYRNYSNIELERKAKQIKVLHQDYPNVPEYWLDMLYDYLATKSEETLEKMVNQKFDVLVIDCEGAFYNILNDIPEILDNIKLIIIEMDGPDDKIPFIRNKLIDNKFELVHSQTHPYLNNGNVNNIEFGVINNVNELYKLKCRKNMIGFHEVYIKF